MRLLQIAIAIHLFGLFVLNLFASLDITGWVVGYYIWDKSFGAGCIIWLVLYELLPTYKKWIVRPVLLVSLLRSAWQILAYCIGWDLNNAIWLTVIFIVLTAAASYLTLNENSSGNNWLRKHLNL